MLWGEEEAGASKQTFLLPVLSFPGYQKDKLRGENCPQGPHRGSEPPSAWGQQVPGAPRRGAAVDGSETRRRKGRITEKGNRHCKTKTQEITSKAKSTQGKPLVWLLTSYGLSLTQQHEKSPKTANLSVWVNWSLCRG